MSDAEVAIEKDRSRGWCFTWNNYPEDWLRRVRSLGAGYFVVGEEVAPTTGTPHLQGYVYFKSQRRMPKMRPPHWVPANGNALQNRAYCTKDGKFVEEGERPLTQSEKGIAGKAVYEAAWALAKVGRIGDIEEPLRTRFYGTYKRIRADYQEQPGSIDDLDNYWFWGETGVGKSSKALADYPDHYLKNPNKWWCGYVDQETVIIDEWSPEHSVLASYLKRWADHHPFAAEHKGGSMCIRPRRIVVTSNYSPEECFPNSQDCSAIRRRFKVVHMLGNVTLGV